jgi:hypothetical protein
VAKAAANQRPETQRPKGRWWCTAGFAPPVRSRVCVVVRAGASGEWRVAASGGAAVASSQASPAVVVA